MTFLLRFLPLLKAVPLQYRAIAGIAVALIVVGIVFGAGFKVAGWKAGAEQADMVAAHSAQVLAMTQEHAQELSGLSRYSRDLEDAITANNERLAVAAAQTAAAEQARAAALRNAADLAASSQRRIDRLQASSAESCSEVLANYWSIRQ